MPAFWGVVRSLPKRKAFAAERLRVDDGFEVFLPLVQTKRASAPLFSGYFFCRIIDRWRSINSTFGVLCLVRVGDCPARSPDHEIDSLKATINGHGYITTPACAPQDRDRRPGANCERAIWRDERPLRRHEHQGPREDLAQSSRQPEAGAGPLQPGHSGAVKRDGSWTGRRRRNPNHKSIEPEPEPEPQLVEPEPVAAHAPWVKSISSYERKETTIVEGLRHG
jgi:hypothetical protein